MTTIALRTAKTRFQTPARAVRTTAGCPIITWRSPQEELDRIAESATDGTTFKREIRGLATLHDCHRIPTWITQWETRYEGLVEEGWDIYPRSRLTWA